MLIDVTTYDSQQQEFIEVPDHGTVAIYRNAPFSMTSSAAFVPALVTPDEAVATDESSLGNELVGVLPWDAPEPPAPPRGFENLPTRK